jgi:L-seryl-tRNA(Ser) seleniumtransferase
MLEVNEDELQRRAQRLADTIGDGAEIVRAIGKVGGGALPLLELEGPAVALHGHATPVAVAQALRAADPPVIARIHEGRVLLDPRTMTDDELDVAAAAARAALAP